MTVKIMMTAMMMMMMMMMIMMLIMIMIMTKMMTMMMIIKMMMMMLVRVAYGGALHMNHRGLLAMSDRHNGRGARQETALLLGDGELYVGRGHGW